jgi:hypothetical protein
MSRTLAKGATRALRLPFEELRRRSHINAAAQAADQAADFSQRIRAGLPKSAASDSQLGKVR